jgi:ribonuclease VapC
LAAPVLDASALLAQLWGEPGSEEVTQASAEGAVISTVNLAEVLARASDRGRDPVRLARQLAAAGVLGGVVTVEPLTRADAIESARLRPLTRSVGLSLADRACLALARRLDAPALTADGAWAKCKLDVEVRLIR